MARADEFRADEQKPMWVYGLFDDYDNQVGFTFNEERAISFIDVSIDDKLITNYRLIKIDNLFGKCDHDSDQPYEHLYHEGEESCCSCVNETVKYCADCHSFRPTIYYLYPITDPEAGGV
jgi:hypothetical protein